MYHTRKWLAGGAALMASGLGLLGLAAGPQGSTTAQAAAPTGSFAASVPLQAPSTGVRRESGVISHNGPPLTGPASAYRSLDLPNFGPNVRANTDTQTPNLAQQEPSIAVNPTNPLNVVAAAKDERGGSNTKQVWIYTSTDGGTTWINQIFPFLPPSSPYSSDPVVSFSDDGQCYLTALPYGGGANDGIQVARSLDGGITFSTGVKLPGSNSNSDKEWTWVDNNPISPYYHRIYVAWMDFGSGSTIRLNYSTDRGLSWSSAAVVTTSAYQFPMPVSFPNGDVIVTYASTGSSVGYRRSTNGGVSFGSLVNISSATQPNCPPDNSGCSIWRLSGVPATTVDDRNGNAVVTWSDGRTGKAVIYYSRSTDNGGTWSAAAQLSPPGTNVYQIEPWVGTDEQGIMHTIWYDDVSNPNTSIFDIYYSQSTDDGVTWSPAVRISTATSDLRIGIPSSYNRAAGDYINVTASHGNVYGVWTDTRSGTGEDVYVVHGTYSAPNLTPTPIITSIASSTATVLVLTPTATSTTQPTSTSTAVSTSTSIIPTITISIGSATPVGTGTVTAIASGTSTAATTSTAQATTTAGTPVATATVCTIRFADVAPDYTFYSVIRCLACRHIIGGYPCGSVGEPCNGTNDPYFRPGNKVTRGQISKMVVLASGLPASNVGQEFEDVPPSNNFYNEIQTLAAHSYIGGYPCGSVPSEPCVAPNNRPYFRPSTNTSRGQLAKIVSSTADFNGDPDTQIFADVTPSSPFYIWIQRLANRSIIGGYPCGGPGEPCDSQNRPYFRPNNSVTRGQTAKIVANTFLPNCQTPAR